MTAVESRYVAVIPARNEAATIARVAAGALAGVATVIVVDDGSTDGTHGELEGLPVTLLRNEHNLGKGASLWRGMQHALALGAEGVVTLDGDGQHAPEDISRLLRAARAHPQDIVIGARLSRARGCAARTATRQLLRRLLHRLGGRAAARRQPVRLPRVPRVAAAAARGEARSGIAASCSRARR